MTSASTFSEETETPSGPQGEEKASSSQSAELIAHLPERDLPAPVDSWIPHGQVPRGGEPVVLIHQTALLQIVAHGQSNLDTELGGALLGIAYRHRNTTVVEVRATLPVISGDHGPVHFTFSADSWSQLQRDRETNHPHLDIVGWFHTHPDLGVFYSGDDVVVHSAAFTLPWHIGLVFDPIRQEAALFGWKDDILQPLAGFYELPERQPTSVVDWSMPETAVWDSAYEPTPLATEAYSSRVVAPARRVGTSVTGRELGLLLGALSLLLTFLLLIGVVLPMRDQINTLETTVLTLANESLAESNALSCPDPRLRILSPLMGSILPAGSQVDIIGTTAHPDAARYQFDVRRAGDRTWALLDRVNRSTRLDVLTTVDTSQIAPGEYELRLSAVDGNNIRLGNSTPCFINLNVVP